MQYIQNTRYVLIAVLIAVLIQNTRYVLIVESIAVLIACSEHSPLWSPNGKWMTCRGCSARVNKDNLRGWLVTVCAKPFYPNTMGIIKPGILPTSIQVGKSFTHHSHKIRIYRGLCFCQVCGSRGPSKLVNLSDRCRPAIKGSYGYSNLVAIGNGRLPQGLASWPDNS